MKVTTQSNDRHPPLARDVQGNLLPVPEGTCAWRICRHTKGRPRIINGPDKQPARFPLDLTPEELLDSCGADTYRIYALDNVGNVIDYVTTFEGAHELRNAAPLDAPAVPVLRTQASGSDLRYALEAISQIAKTNADAMRAVAESQAEWIKSISSARGFFRNAPQVQLAAPIDADADEGEAKELDTKKHWIDSIMPIVGIVAQQLLASMSSKKDGATPSFELGDLFDWRRAKSRAEAIPALRDAPASEYAPIDPVALRAALASKAAAVGALLTVEERSRLMKLAPMLMKLADDPEISKILAELVAMSSEEAVAWIRTHLDMMEKRLLS